MVTRILALLFLALPCLGQVAFTFTDQPFLGADSGISSPTNIAPAAYWWAAEDLAADSPVSTWTDRIVGFNLVQTNSWNQPTNSSFGLCFDGANRYLITSNRLDWNTNSSVTFILSSSSFHRSGILFGTNTASQYAVYTDTNYLAYNLAGLGVATGLQLNSNLYDVTISTDYTTNNIFTNGMWAGRVVATSSNQVIDVVGGRYIDWTGTPVPYDGSFAGYIRDIIMWTNHTITTNEAMLISQYKVAKYGTASAAQFFDPASITGCKGWFRADGWIEKVAREQATNGASVTRWANSAYNKSTTPWALATLGLGWYYNSGPNNKPSIDFGTSSGQFGVTIGGAHPNTIFVVAIVTNTALTGVMIDGDLVNRQMVRFTGTTSLNMYAGTSGMVLPYPYSSTNWTVYTIGFNSVNSYCRTNGVLLGTGNPGNNTITTTVIGDYEGGGFHFGGRIAEVIYYNASLSTNDVQSVENYLLTKYAL